MDVLIMDIPKIPGECQLAGFAGKIELLSFGHGLMMQINNDPRGERTADRPNHQDFIVTKRMDLASPLINLACCTGKDQGTVKITVGRKDDKGGVTTFMVYELSQVIISTVSISGGGGETPMESVALNYTRIKWAYTAHPAQGPVKTIANGWDLVDNKAL